MRPNWFVAFPIPAGPWLEAALATAPPGLRRFRAEDLHATLAFLGLVPEENARAGWEVARAAAASIAPVEATLDRVVAMGSLHRWSALSATFGEGNEALAGAIGAQRDAILEVAGARPDTRAPKPHVTIARPTRHTTVAERQAALAWAQALDLGAPRVRIDRLALYTWSEDRRERLFRIVEEVPLGRRG